MVLLCSFLILCCSLVQSWEIDSSQRDVISAEGLDQFVTDSSLEDTYNSPETVRMDNIMESSVFPFLRETEAKSSPIFSHTGPGNVNAAIRLKFNNAEDESVTPFDYNLKQDVTSNDHASHSQTQEMSSHKVILYNQTKTQEEGSKSSSNNLHQHLNKWHANDASQIDLNDYIISNAARGTYKDVTPGAIIQEIVAGGENQKIKTGRFGQHLDNQQAILNMFKQYVGTSVNKRFEISEPQMQLLNLLYKLVQSKEITYDFINRLVYLLHTHGYRNQLLQVLFDFIFKQLRSQGDSEYQQKTLNNFMEIWNVLYRLQGETNDYSHIYKQYRPDTPSSSDKLKVLKILQLLNALRIANKNGNYILRSNYLNQIKTLYNSVNNKNEVIKSVKYHLKKQQFDENDIVSIERILSNVHGHGKKQFHVNELMRSIHKQKTEALESDEVESTERMYQVLQELLQSGEIRNKEELKVKIIEMLKKIKSRKGYTYNESIQDGSVGLVNTMNLLNKQNYKIAEKKVCVVGISWTVECQSCICMVGGVPLCKRIPNCILGSELDRPMQCKPHSQFRLDKCNICKCNSVGIPICTLMECDEGVITDSGMKILHEQDALRAMFCPPKKKLPVCAPRTSWRGGCYDCICDDDGQRHCNVIQNCKFPQLG